MQQLFLTMHKIPQIYHVFTTWFTMCFFFLHIIQYHGIYEITMILPCFAQTIPRKHYDILWCALDDTMMCEYSNI